MPPSMPEPPRPPASTPGQPQNTGPQRSKWSSLRRRANTIGAVIALLLFVAVAGGVFGYYLNQTKKSTPPAKTPSIATLTPQEIQQLGSIGANLGTTNQVLNIGADTLFRGNANVVGNLTVGGHLNANGPVTLSQLDITGTTAATGLSVGSNLSVSGITTLQKGLTVDNLETVNGSLTVSGALSASSITASSIATNTIAITGPLTVAHLKTNGPTPFFANGATGTGGTVSIDGNDTAGTIQINTGIGPAVDGVLMTVTFRAAYSSAPRVLLSPTSKGAAISQAYVDVTGTGFSVLANNPTASTNLGFDYFVTQ
jgi:hypothetical protein